MERSFTTNKGDNGGNSSSKDHIEKEKAMTTFPNFWEIDNEIDGGSFKVDRNRL